MIVDFLAIKVLTYRWSQQKVDCGIARRHCKSISHTAVAAASLNEIPIACTTS